MENLKLRKQVNFRILAGVLIGAALAPAMCAQAPPQLKVEVGPNQQVTILASHVSYGEVLRALRGKLGWEIEIPALADELKTSYVRVETTPPQDALAKLLEGSGLGYAFLGGIGKSRIKVVVIPVTPRKPRPTPDTASNSPIPDQAAAEASLPLPTPVQTVTATPANATAVETMQEQPSAPSTMPLSEAINAIGAPPGVPLDEVGKPMTLPISEAARIMGVPPGMSPGDVGKTTTLPLPTGPGKHP